jgi:hypothetical protein
VAKAEAPSATAEMLALASAPATPAAGSEDKPAEGAAGGAPGAPGSPFAPGQAVPQGYEPAPSQAGAAGGYPAPGGPSGAPGLAGGPPRGGAAGGGTPPPGYEPAGGYPAPGGGYGPGGGGGGTIDANAKADYNTPYTAVQTFLAALKAKDAERLADATALHAATESSAHYRKMFTAILSNDLAPEDLDELAKKFEGFNIMGQNQAKSSGRLGIIVGKAGTGRDTGDQFTRTITVRKEKAGWKVCDISGQREIEQPIMIRGRGTGAVRRR